MLKANSCISIILLGSITLAQQSCDSQSAEENIVVNPPATKGVKKADLSGAIEKIAGDFEGAVLELRKLNEQFPNSVEILVQLGRALVETENFALATFRFEQALSEGAAPEIYLDAANAHLSIDDPNRAQANFEQYLKHHPQNQTAWLSYARLLAESGEETKAINAFSRVPDLCDHKDALNLANMFFKKKLWPQANRWYRESAKREDKLSAEPLLGLLRLSLIENDLDQAESLSLTIEKTLPGTLDDSDLADQVSALLIKRRRIQLLDAGIPPDEKKVSLLASALLGRSTKISAPVVSSGPKIPSSAALLDSSTAIADVAPQISSSQENAVAIESTGLAQAFALPVTSESSLSPVEKSRSAYLEARYSDALTYARNALKSNSSDHEAWRLCSQAHFQLGEVKEAEMTILEAIRHNPFDLNTRLDYLRIARETLDSSRYLAELEKAKELFPDSSEILWELARRYHLVEKMPVTAGILYRKVINITAEVRVTRAGEDGTS